MHLQRMFDALTGTRRHPSGDSDTIWSSTFDSCQRDDNDADNDDNDDIDDIDDDDEKEGVGGHPRGDSLVPMLAKPDSPVVLSFTALPWPTMLSLTVPSFTHLLGCCSNVVAFARL